MPFVKRVVFGPWSYNAQAPSDQADKRAWYAGAARLVREFCASRSIQCVVKGGV